MRRTGVTARARPRKRPGRCSASWRRSGQPSSGRTRDSLPDGNTETGRRVVGTALYRSRLPRVFYLRYHGYKLFFPLFALARYRNLQRANTRRVAFGF